MEPQVVLIADNDAGVSGVLQAVLAREGIAPVEVVEDGVAALARIERGGVGLLICDLDMPRLSGEDLIAKLDAEDDPPAVLVVSAYLDPDTAISLARRRVVRGTLRKPFAIAAFATAVRQALAARGSAAALER